MLNPRGFVMIFGFLCPSLSHLLCIVWFAEYSRSLKKCYCSVPDWWHLGFRTWLVSNTHCRKWHHAIMHCRCWWQFSSTWGQYVWSHISLLITILVRRIYIFFNPRESWTDNEPINNIKLRTVVVFQPFAKWDHHAKGKMHYLGDLTLPHYLNIILEWWMLFLSWNVNLVHVPNELFYGVN